MTAPIDEWAAALWAYYRPIIQSGAPLYLAADRWLIGLVSANHGFGDNEEAAVRSFHSACLTLLDRTDAHATVRSETFRKVEGTAGSCAICLAVQQVLVVEHMLKDTKFSANSYFPRYRAVLGLADTVSRSNPLRGTGFQDIWCAVATEIRSVRGATERTITFEPGAGPELNRHLPISQGLLSAHDLTVILHSAPSLNEATEHHRMMATIQAARSDLGKRAKLLLAKASHDDRLARRICGQVRAFLAWDAALLSELRPRATSVEQPGVLVAYLERADLFSSEVVADRFSVYLRTDNAQLGGGALESAIGTRLSRQGSILLALDGDRYREIRCTDDLGPQEAVLAILEARYAERFTALARNQYSALFARTSSNLPESYATMLCTAGTALLVNEILGHPASERRLELDGGLLVDARSHKYLAGFTPTAVLRRGSRLSEGTVVKVNGIRRCAGDFIEELARECQTKTYVLEAGPDMIECTVVAVRSATGEESPLIGYRIHAGELAPMAAELEFGVPALRGTSFTAGFRESALSDRDVALLIGDGARIVVPEHVIAELLNELGLLPRDNLRAGLAARRLASSKSVPVAAIAAGVLKRLLSRGAQDSV